jgi:RNA polymerase-binding protein DksA
VAIKASRKSSAAKKPAGGAARGSAGSSAGQKAKTAKAAVVAAKPKTPSRTVAAPLPKSSKTNGSAKPVVVAPAVAKGKPASKPAAAPAVKWKVESRKALPELPPRPIPEAVPTNGKPRKNQAGLSSKELEHYRDLLLEKRRELVGDMYSMESEALRTSGGTNLSSLPLHMADMGTDNYEQEFTLGLVEKDRGLLREINTALAKIQNGTFGICEGTGKPIGKPRLEAQPWARHSIEYARQTQRPMGMGRVG